MNASGSVAISSPAPFAELAAVSERVRALSSRTEKVSTLASLLRGLTTDERKVAVDMLAGSLPQGRIGVGWATLSTLEFADGPSSTSVSLLDVDQALTAIRDISGAGSKARRFAALQELFARLGADEAEYLRRLLLGGVRQGAGKGLVLEAVAQATDVEIDQVHRAHTRGGRLGASLDVGTSMELFRPIAPMLASAAKDLGDGIERSAPALVEAKADGARIQLHKRGSEVRVYSRTGNDVTDSVPELVEVGRGLNGDGLILDGEALVWVKGKPAAFQTTMRRFGARGADASTRARLPLRVFFFDCLACDERELLDQPLSQRRATLEDVVAPQHLLPATRIESGASAHAAEQLLAQARTDGFEGVMVKALGSPYTAGKRGSAWLKVKPVHSLDLVVLAAEWGSGRRRGWLSNLHLGARDEGTGDFVMLGKTFKGLTDETLAWQTEELQRLETHRTRSTVWVRPERVVEIAFDGVQQSPRYPAGVTLRFARVKGYRPDKSATEADTIATVHAIHTSQPGYEPPEEPAQRDLFDL